jgi:hypothetical protein
LRFAIYRKFLPSSLPHTIYPHFHNSNKYKDLENI